MVNKEDLIGSIAKGKLADFAVLSKNPYDVPVEEIKDIAITETWIAGKKVFEKEATLLMGE